MTELPFDNDWLYDEVIMKKAIKRLVSEWTNKLGIGHWQVNVNFYREKAQASCYAEPEYNQAWLNFNVSGILDLYEINYDVEEVVVHELCHCKSWDLISLLESFIEDVQDKKAKKKLLEVARKYDENLVETMSCYLVMSKYGLTNRPKTVRIAGWEKIKRSK